MIKIRSGDTRAEGLRYEWIRANLWGLRADVEQRRLVEINNVAYQELCVCDTLHKIQLTHVVYPFYPFPLYN